MKLLATTRYSTANWLQDICIFNSNLVLQLLQLLMMFSKKIARILINSLLIATFLFKAEKYDSCIAWFKTHWF